MINKNLFKISFGMIIFLGALLLFFIQPLIGKIVTPQYGGTSQVWCLCLLFFQLILLLGYFLTFLISKISIKYQGILYSLLLIFSMLLFNIPSTNGWVPDDLNYPIANLLKQFTIYLLPPVLVLSTISTIMQKWYSLSTRQSPYYLYSISNLGSMSSLLLYPWLIEPNFTVEHSLFLWKTSYIVLFISALIVSLFITYKANELIELKEPTQQAKSSIPFNLMLYWIFLASCGTVLLISFTNHIIHDIAPVPLFWIIPLALYLLSFILSFANSKFYHRKFFLNLSYVLLLINYFNYFGEIFGSNFFINTFLNLSLLFTYCMICHGEIYKTHPSADKLPVYYLNIALGGAIGGIFVNLICPLIFSQYIEFPLIQIIMVIFTGYLIYRYYPSTLLNPKFKNFYIGLICFVFVIFTYFTVFSSDNYIITRERNFYGTVKLNYSYDKDSIILVNGVTKHGLQLIDRTTNKLINFPTAYFGKHSAVDIINHIIRKENPNKPLKYAIIGLGAGTIAYYAEKEDVFTFYDIDPKIITLANKYFNFLKDSKAKINIVLADGRLALKKELNHSFDLLIIDAFNSDSIPIHLLTNEAVYSYLKVVKNNGYFLFHISNRFLDLNHVIANIAIKNDMLAFNIKTINLNTKNQFTNEYVVILHKNQEKELIKYLNPNVTVKKLEFKKEIGIWTDDYSSILHLLKIN